MSKIKAGDKIRIIKQDIEPLYRCLGGSGNTGRYDRCAGCDVPNGLLVTVHMVFDNDDSEDCPIVILSPNGNGSRCYFMPDEVEKVPDRKWVRV